MKGFTAVIFGVLSNLPVFIDGVDLGSMLENKFALPMFINNNGDLYSYDEAKGEFLPYINGLLPKGVSPKSYKK